MGRHVVDFALRFVDLDPEEQLKRELKLAEWNVGRQGPLGTAHLKTMTELEMKAHQVVSLIISQLACLNNVTQSLLNLGLPEAAGPVSFSSSLAFPTSRTHQLTGDPDGAFLIPNTIDPKTSTRTYSTTAYYEPNATRENFSVLVNANVNKIIFKEGSDPLEATGVEFEYSGKTYVVNSDKETILAAG